MTKVFAINGSASMEEGSTAEILEPFLEGLRDAQAEVELRYARRLNIKPCNGEFHCWYKKPGQCQISDGMQSIYPILRESDILVLATPVYLPLPGEMQNFLNRFMPLIEPILSLGEGHTRARLHSGVKLKRVVLLSAGGWWERENLLTVLRIAREVAEKAGMEFSGAVLRPHAFLMHEHEEKAREITGALRKAGRQLIEEGRISEELLDIIAQPLVPEEELRRRYNDMYRRVSDKRKE